MDEACDLHIEAAVFRNLEELALAPPFDGVETVRSFSNAEGRLGDILEFETVANGLIE